MPKAVVDVLETVEIEKQDREEVLLAALGLSDGDPQPVHEEGPVGKTREGVVHGIVEQLLLGHLASMDIGQRAGHPVRRAGRW